MISSFPRPLPIISLLACEDIAAYTPWYRPYAAESSGNFLLAPICNMGPPRSPADTDVVSRVLSWRRFVLLKVTLFSILIFQGQDVQNKTPWCSGFRDLEFAGLLALLTPCSMVILVIVAALSEHF